MPNTTSPDLSVLVPTYGRPGALDALLSALDAQSLPAHRFELVVVDDGSPQPVEIDESQYAFSIQLLRQENQGPAAARNTGLAQVQAPLTLILNDDAIPAPNLLEEHLRAHAELFEEGEDDVAVMGSFPFTAEALKSPFVQLLANSNLLFSFTELQHNQMHDWMFFWTCNISLPTATLRAVDGFDAERFRDAIVEDVELGYRLEQRFGLRVLYREDLVAQHDHVLDIDGYMARMRRLGINLAKMYQKHEDPKIVWCDPSIRVVPDFSRKLQATYESYLEALDRLVTRVRQFDADHLGKSIENTAFEELVSLIRRVGMAPFSRGMLEQLLGQDPGAIVEAGPTPDLLTSVIVVSHDSIDQTTRCLEALRATAQAEYPTQLIFVDNGSSDGTREFLAEQRDVHLIANTQNVGAPAARNQALAVATGDYVAFMDNDVFVSERWLERLLYHAQVDPRSGFIGCVADRAGHKQAIDYPGDSSMESITDFANARYAAMRRKFEVVPMLSSFLILARRPVIDAVGGFDERFSPWGFEDDDISLRAWLGGYTNRVAKDVFVRHEPYAGVVKARAHGDLLERNWVRFARKWGLEDAGYGDYSQLAPLLEVDWPEDELHVDPASEERAGHGILACPDWDVESLQAVLEEVAPLVTGAEGAPLFLRVHFPDTDALEAGLTNLEAAYSATLPDGADLDVRLIDNPDPELARTEALLLCANATLVGADAAGVEWMSRVGLPALPQLAQH